MTDEAALLAAIRDRPDDDTPRLVYADWLDDNGHADRAVYIRAAIECGRIADGDPRKREAWAAERAAMGPGKRWWTWYGPGDRINVLRWRRGFVDELATDAATWMEFGDVIVKSHPVRRVVLTTTPDVIFAATRTDEYEDKVMPGRRLVSRWRAYCGGTVTDFGREVSITRLDEFEGNEPLIREMLNARVEADRTPQAYLRARWEKIEFELPPPAPDYWGPPPAAAAMPAYQALRDAQDRLIRYFQRTAGLPHDRFVTPAPPSPPG